MKSSGTSELDAFMEIKKKKKQKKPSEDM